MERVWGGHLQSTGPSLPPVLPVQRILAINSVDLEFNLNGDFCFFFFLKFLLRAFHIVLKTLALKQGLKCI